MTPAYRARTTGVWVQIDRHRARCRPRTGRDGRARHDAAEARAGESEEVTREFSNHLSLLCRIGDRQCRGAGGRGGRLGPAVSSAGAYRRGTVGLGRARLSCLHRTMHRRRDLLGRSRGGGGSAAGDAGRGLGAGLDGPPQAARKPIAAPGRAARGCAIPGRSRGAANDRAV